MLFASLRHNTHRIQFNSTKTGQNCGFDIQALAFSINEQTYCNSPQNTVLWTQTLHLLLPNLKKLNRDSIKKLPNTSVEKTNPAVYLCQVVWLFVAVLLKKPLPDLMRTCENEYLFFLVKPTRSRAQKWPHLIPQAPIMCPTFEHLRKITHTHMHTGRAGEECNLEEIQ